MQKHWKVIQWASILALAAFIGAAMTGSYLAMYGVVFSAFVIGCAYLIVVAKFKGRQDSENRKEAAP